VKKNINSASGTLKETKLMETETYDETMVTRVSLHPFLAGLNRPQLVLLTDCAISIRFKPGEIILRAGDRADRFFLIETGKVVLESGGDHGESVVVDTIGAGDLLGWSWMFPPYAWQFTARAVAPTRAIFFAGSVLREYCERDHSLGYELMKRINAVMTRRMQNARQKMLGIHSGKVFLEPVLLEPPFLDQELNEYSGVNSN
jgi:CRP/FNR family cyclic AMP-dependent transcriptional regulator